MGLLSTLKSLLGMEEESRSAGNGVDVTVERDPSADSERAVKESTAGQDDEAEDEEPVAAETDASASTESLVDEDHTDDPTRAAEPAEAASTGGDDEAEESEAVDGEPVTVLDGIGPAYADRLADAGVETVDDLAAADPDDLAERIDLSAKRVGRWVDSAQDHD
ncbi:helix-hairpin-helix domain-containing protein [Halobacterium sp. CBA1126]|uniref:helix-hairpin-helix domain-containing protein n=1 Tax=Halobacterium sp. CBA1126 TaxID=2668074 RepID=UPI0012FCF575|nr:helix-hairpin-helix domain-containing protein [Halobacterium sp. CBA1126]MUV61005.1 helix-hairpin-helix domain-containing protein [Halobacterium sp. CBA1126]